MRLSKVARARAIGQIEACRSFSDIAVYFCVHRSTIFRLDQRYMATGSVDDRPRSGQPRVTSEL